MQNDFEQPENAPVNTRVESPVKMKLEYKPGKTPAQYAKHADPKTDEKIGFRYYDKDLKRNVKMDKVTMFAIGMYAQVAGAVKITDSEYRNYQTNLIADTRTDILVLKEAFIQDAPLLCKGDYQAVKKFISDAGKKYDGVGYRSVLVCYVRELDKVVHLECSQRLQYALKKSIATATGEQIGKVSLLGLAALSSEIWAFAFNGEYAMVDEKDKEYSGKGDLYCAPVLSCGVIKPTTKNYEDLFSYVSSVQDQMRDYINEQQSYYGSPESNSRQNANQEHGTPAYSAPAGNDFDSPMTQRPPADPFPTYSEAPPDMDALPF